MSFPQLVRQLSWLSQYASGESSQVSTLFVLLAAKDFQVLQTRVFYKIVLTSR